MIVENYETKTKIEYDEEEMSDYPEDEDEDYFDVNQNSDES